MLQFIDNFKTFNNKKINEQHDENIQYYDLFDYYDKQPEELQKITIAYASKLDELSYDELREFEDAVNKIGYTFDWGLDAIPFGLRPIGVESNQLI
jgi:hypothetical protein